MADSVLTLPETGARKKRLARLAGSAPERRYSGHVAGAALLVLPGVLVVYFAFNSGGFHPAAPAFVAALLSVALLLRIALSAKPFIGVSWELGIAAGALLGLTLLTLLSGAWSHAPGVARVEFDLPLVYLLAMVLFGSIGRTEERMRWALRGVGAATVIVCCCGLVTRLLPHLWPTSPGVANQRLSFPVTYWNALGLLSAMGVVLCVHISSDLREHRVARVLAAAAVPILATTLYFTFSRGAIAVCIVALVVYAIVGRPLGLISSAVAAAPATLIALKVAYDASVLATPNPTTPAAVAQGHHVTAVLVACVSGAALIRAALIPTVDRVLRRLTLPRLPPMLRGRWGWLAVAGATLLVLLALSGPIAHQYQRFVHPAPPNSADFRTRLTDPGNNGRLEYWRVAWHGFKLAPVVGNGAGSYTNTWAADRRTDLDVKDAHSLYLETLDELGIVGLLLLLTTLVTILAVVAARARGPARPLYAAVLAVLLAWVLHAGLDWDWEMPVVTIVVFALGGLALSRRVDPGREVPARRRPTRLLARVPLAVAALIAGVIPAYTWLSQAKLDNAAYAFSQGDCKAARSSALSAISVLGNRAEPYEILSYCDLRLGMSRAALTAIRRAAALDPGNWNYRYGLALMSAANGLDPRPITKKAVSMNPREPLVQEEWATFRSAKRSQWPAEAKSIAARFTTL